MNRFDEETKLGFLDLYAKVDAKVDAVEGAVGAPTPVTPDNDIPF